MARHQKKIERITTLAGIIANPTRASIVLVLHEQKGAYVHEIEEVLGMSQSAISHQLAFLVEEGIVTFKKEGRDVFYALSKKPASRRLLKALRIL